MSAVKDKKGFTLIELIVVIAIMGIILTAVSGLFIYIPGFFKKANARSQLQSEAVALMETVEVKLRTATAVQLGGSKPADMIEPVSSAILSQYELSATYQHTEKGVLKVSLTGDGGKYVLTREIFLINSKNNSADIITGDATGTLIYIKIP